MIAYRIEHDDGFGPFVAYDKEKRERRQHSVFHCNSPEALEIRRRHERFPTPSEERLDIRKNGVSWYCAYYSLKQIKELYNKDMILWLYKNNYKIKSIVVDEQHNPTQYGSKQILFTTRKSEVSISI